MGKERMTDNNKKALICAFLLAKYGSLALSRLKHRSFSEAFSALGRILRVKPSTIKNMRDEFDPLFGSRKGWYQRPLRPSRQSVFNMFGEKSLEELMAFVEQCLKGRTKENLFLEEPLLAIGESKKKKRAYTELHITGKKAELFFKKNFSRIRPGEICLKDKTDSGCGYDFHAERKRMRIFYEVKGLRANVGPIRLTQKEWSVANKEKGRYHLAVVTNLGNSPKVKIIQNPAKLKAKPRTTIVSQVHYHIDQKQIAMASANSFL